MSSAPRSSSAREDAALVERIVARDEGALSELYDRFSGMLLALARRVLHDQAEAEDVLQEAFVQVWKQAGRYDRRRSSVSTWLVLITRSRAIDRLRSRKVVDRTAQSSHNQNPRTDTSPEGVGNVLLRERRNVLRQELANLPSEQREVIEMAFYQGLTQSEIAERSSIPLGTVKTRTLLAMKKLRKALKSEIHELL